MKRLKKISVIGMGLLGASVTLAIKREMPGRKIIGYSHRASTRQKAAEYGVADEIVDSLADAVEGVDVIILATPIQTFEDYFKDIAPYLKDGAIVTDVGSTKLLPHEWAAATLPKGVHYVGSHPIAGSEKRGLEYARDDLLAGANCIVTKVRGTDGPSVELLEKFWAKLGCSVEVMSPARHDGIFGRVSHLPHITAAALVNASSSADLKFSGKGFMDTTRVASGPANVWTDILMTNPQTCVEGLDALIEQLKNFRKAVKAGDEGQVNKLLAAAGEKRAKMIKHKLKQKELF